MTTSRMVKVSLKCECVSMHVRGTINIPEVLSSPVTISEETAPESSSSAFSPTNSLLSEDSGRCTGTTLWPSSKFFVYGGPGFSIGILDSTSGCLERLPIPVPTPSLLEAADASNFSLSEVTCLMLVGESQVWAGTEAGSLHVFDLSMQFGRYRLSNHGYFKLPEAVTCLKVEQLVVGRGRRSGLRTEVLVGSMNNTLTVVSGEVDERGGLRNVDKCPRKVVHLGSHYEEEEEEKGEGGSVSGVHSIAMVSSQSGALEECYWCACGSNIVVLRHSNWAILKLLKKCVDLSSEGGVISHLETTDYGVWCSVQHSPTVILWDVREFLPKLKISCFNAGPETPLLEHQSAQVTCLVYCDPLSLLLVGTRGGCLLVFFIHGKHRRYRNMSLPEVHSLPSSPRMNASYRKRLSYTVLTSCQCYPRPITSIHPISVQGSSMGGMLESPSLASPSNGLNILVVFGGRGGESEGRDDVPVESVVHVYELASSPLTSPMTSPHTTPVGRASAMSVQSLPASSSNRKCSLQNLDSMPKLSLYRVSNEAITYLPLPENSVW